LDDHWWIYRDGAIVGPATTDLVVRGLMAGKIPHDARVRADEVSEWIPILNIDIFAEATQKTTLFERPPSMSKLEVAKPAETEKEGRFWYAPEWMLLLGDVMSGPFSLLEIHHKKPPVTAQVCKLHTFDWLRVDEAFAMGGKAPTAADPDEPMYIVHHDDDEQGPTSIEQLSKAHAAGRLNDDDVVVRFGTSEKTPLRDLLRDHGLLRPKLMDRTVVVARKLGSDPQPRDTQRAILLAILGVVAMVVLGVVALALR
jgi:hypothetical protein